MTEETNDEQQDPEERLNEINKRAVTDMQGWLRQLENKEVVDDDVIATMYGAMITVALLGYDVVTMADDATKSAENIFNIAVKDQQPDS